MAPPLTRLTGTVYNIAAFILTGVFIALSYRVLVSREKDPTKMKDERRLFKYSIFYLFALFGALIWDQWLFA